MPNFPTDLETARWLDFSRESPLRKSSRYLLQMSCYGVGGLYYDHGEKWLPVHAEMHPYHDATKFQRYWTAIVTRSDSGFEHGFDSGSETEIGSGFESFHARTKYSRMSHLHLGHDRRNVGMVQVPPESVPTSALSGSIALVNELVPLTANSYFLELLSQLGSL